jgi:hypothetical protein
MTLPSRLLGAAAVAATTASLAVPGVAGAKAGDSTLQQTYPVASRVCANVAAGKARKRLQRFAPQVLADCSALQTAFTAAQSAVLAARASIEAQAAADRAALAAACPASIAGKPPCPSKRAQEQDALAALHRLQVQAARRYWRAVEAGRHRFWHAIRALPGEHHARADTPIAELND